MLTCKAGFPWGFVFRAIIEYDIKSAILWAYSSFYLNFVGE